MLRLHNHEFPSIQRLHLTSFKDTLNNILDPLQKSVLVLIRSRHFCFAFCSQEDRLQLWRQPASFAFRLFLHNSIPTALGFATKQLPCTKVCVPTSKAAGRLTLHNFSRAGLGRIGPPLTRLKLDLWSVLVLQHYLLSLP